MLEKTLAYIALILATVLLISERMFFANLVRRFRNSEPSNGEAGKGISPQALKTICAAEHDRTMEGVKGVFYPPLQDLKQKTIELSGVINRVNESNMRVALMLDTRMEFDREMRNEIRRLSDAVNGLSSAIAAKG